jgi:hypothetical protein
VHLPARTATDDYLARMGERLDVVFDVDLGELAKGHHIVARGLALGRSVPAPRFDRDELRRRISGSSDPANGGGFFGRKAGQGPDAEEHVHTEAELHYEFVPALNNGRSGRFDPTPVFWMVYASDDVGTAYNDYNTGAYDGSSTGPSSHGNRDIGGQVPPEATRLTLTFKPAFDWKPPEPWRRELVIDLVNRRLVE